jgi:hypothetical protein
MNSDQLISATMCIDSVHDYLSFYNIRLPDKISIVDNVVVMQWEDLTKYGMFVVANFNGNKCKLHFNGFWTHTFNWHEAYDKFYNQELSF